MAYNDYKEFRAIESAEILLKWVEENEERMQEKGWEETDVMSLECSLGSFIRDMSE